MTVGSGTLPDPERAPGGLRGAWTVIASPVAAGGRGLVDTATRCLHSVQQGLWECVIATTLLLVPFVARTRPCTRDTSPLPRPAMGPSPCVPHRPDRPGWTDRSVVCLARVSAWRNARHASAWVVPAPPHASAATPASAEPRAGGPRSPDRVDGALGTFDAWGSKPRPAAEPAADADRQPPFPIDVVYTWVNDRDPTWRARYSQASETYRRDGFDGETGSPARFHNRDELRYSLRSLAAYAPFVRNVYIVTSGQSPSWLDPGIPNVRVVPHEEILDPDCLPTFNSHAIESALHRIEGLAEHYLYLNDDFFFGRLCHPSTFFTADGQPKFFCDPRATIPDGPRSPADRPVDSASKNTREIMHDEFGFLVKHKMQHVPYPQRRSVLEDMEQRFPWVFKQTARNPFRHHSDVNIPSCFSHYYAYVTGAAVPGRISASYVNIGNPLAQAQMRRLRQRADREVFCLNDCPMSFRRQAVIDTTVKAFLDAYFPVASSFELPQDPSRQ